MVKYYQLHTGLFIKYTGGLYHGIYSADQTKEIIREDGP